jgi:hypothetical protein
MIARFCPFTRRNYLSAAVLVVLAAVSQGCDARGGGPGTQGTGTQTSEYSGDIHGVTARVQVSFERLRNYTLMAGEVRTNVSHYAFTADIVGSAGYGQMLDRLRNQRFQIKVELTRGGFKLTSNPFGPGTPSTYYFAKR